MPESFSPAEQTGPSPASSLPRGAHVFAVVVWFHPTVDDAQNISSYLPFVEGVIIVDNSPVRSEQLLPADEKVSYHADGENKGIAAALNVGCRLAVARGATWLLTMDQDSAFEEVDIRKLLDKLLGISDEVAILCPNWHGAANTLRTDLVDRDSAITSGSLVNAAAFLQIGGYNEDLFLDEVDHEFGYRLRRAGRRILVVQSVSMHHRVGEPLSKRVLWRKVKSSNHNAVRKYYMTRNRLYMRKNFSEFGCPYLEFIVTDALKVLLVEQNKARKLLYMARGIVDHLRGIMGRIAFKDLP